jgi:hypothetical protein
VIFVRSVRVDTWLPFGESKRYSSPMRRTLLLTLLLSVSLTAQQRAPEIESIRQQDLKADLFFLASDGMRGRLTDTPENRMAAEWIASRFARLGLKPVGDDGTYFQSFKLVTAVPMTAGNRLLVGGATVETTDYYPTRFSDTASASGEVVFVGYGISSPERQHDDYRGGVQGKIVLAIDHEPGESDPNSIFDGVVTSQASNQLHKALAAQAKGAAGILFVSDVHNHPQQTGAFRANWGGGQQQPRIPSYLLGAWLEKLDIPAMQISPATAARLLGNRTLTDLGKAADAPDGIKPVATGVTAQMTAAVTRSVIDDRNVVGLIEGSDPKLKDEIVIVCAHYDHDGANGETILNGADDDGSGTVGVMEIAEAYALAAANGQRPRRSVLFAAWNSEERGLLGAWAYTEKPIFPLKNTVAVLNMDMIGRNEEVPENGGNRFRGLEVQTAESNSNAMNVIGTVKSPTLKPVIEKANTGIGLTLRYRYDNNSSQLMRRSDHWPFINHGIPGVWIFTGLHPDYHQQTDDADRINYVKMEKILRLVYQASWDLAR